MQMIVLRIFFHGLIALVPTSPGQNQMSALLVDARQGQLPLEASSCVAAHAPMVQFVAQRTADCVNTASDLRCKAVGNHCACVPVRQQITVDATVAPASWQPHVLPAKPLPGTPDEEKAELAYVPNLRSLGFEIDPDFLTKSPPGLLDRVSFAFDAMETCMLAGKGLIGGGSEVHTFHFGKVRDGHEGGLSQAIATMAMARATIPYDPATHKVQISFKSLDNPNAPVRSIELAPVSCDPHNSQGEPCIDINFGNERPMIEFGKDACVDGIDRDFALFYKLTKSPQPAWADRLVPIDDNGPDKVDGQALFVKDCDSIIKNPESRPICAMAEVVP